VRFTNGSKWRKVGKQEAPCVHCSNLDSPFLPLLLRDELAQSLFEMSSSPSLSRPPLGWGLARRGEKGRKEKTFSRPKTRQLVESSRVESSRVKLKLSICQKVLPA